MFQLKDKIILVFTEIAQLFGFYYVFYLSSISKKPIESNINLTVGIATSLIAIALVFYFLLKYLITGKLEKVVLFFILQPFLITFLLYLF